VLRGEGRIVFEGKLDELSPPNTPN
jgi:hypothetical protein